MAHPGHRVGAADWNARADLYAGQAARMEDALRPVTSALLEAVGAAPGIRLLDLACGPGQCTEAARRRGAQVLGLDSSAGMVAAARRQFPESRFEVGDMLAPPAGPWDAIVCRLGAHHVGDQWLGAARAVLAPGGRLGLAELVPAEGHAGKHGMRPASAWQRLLQAAGFEDVQAKMVAMDAPQSIQDGLPGPFQDGRVCVLSATNPRRPASQPATPT